MKRTINVFMVITLAVLLVSCGSKTKAEKSIRKVKCAVVENFEQSAPVVELSAKVHPASESNLSFRVAGVVDRVVVKEGMKVHKGQLLAIMDDRDYKLQLEATQAEYDAIKAEVERVVALYEQQSVTPNDYDKAVNGLKRIEAKLSSHKNALADTRLLAPYSGTVDKVFYAKGEALAAGMPVVSIVSGSLPEVVVSLPAREYARQDKLQRAYAVVDLYPDVEFPLELVGVSSKANLNQLYEARFLVESAGGVTPNAGMSAVVILEYEADSSELMVVPFSAIFDNNSSKTGSVWVLNEGRVSCREVAVEKIKKNGMAVIAEGLKSGEVVVSAGINSLKDGQEVEVLESVSESNVGGIL